MTFLYFRELDSAREIEADYFVVEDGVALFYVETDIKDKIVPCKKKELVAALDNFTLIIKKN